ncbi:MAG: hypothetical protein KAT69_00760, partial [Candidatus Aminicenantes bacterium]|nr:hypothetical protein [Candidatus Aminicenantes bacterium]
SVYLEGEYKSISTPSEKKTDFKGMVRIEPTKIRCETPAFAFGSAISGEFKVSGPLPDIRLSGSLDIEEGSLSRDDLSIQEVTLGLSLDGTSASVEVSRLIGSLKGLSFVSEDKKVELDKVGFDGQGRIDITGKKANLDRLEFQFPPLAPIEINAFVDLQPQGEKSVRLKSTKLDSSELLNLFSSFIPGSVLDLGPMGQFDFDISASQSLEAGEEWDFSGTIGLSGGGFHNSSFTFASESLQQKVIFKGKYNLSKQLMEFTADVDLSQGESLWNAYYVDWSQSPFRMKMSGVYHIPLQKLDDFTAETALFSEGKIDVRGWMSFQDASLVDLRVTATKLDLGSLFVFASQGTPIEEYALDLGGDAEAQVNLRMENNNLSLDGRFWIKDGSVINQ